MNLNQLRLKWKIFAFLLGFCALLLVVLWLFQTVFLESFYKKIKVTEIKRNAAIIVNNIESENIEEIIADMSDNNNIIVTIADPNGKSLLRSFPSDNRRRLEENAVLVTKARNNGGEIHEYITPSAGDRPRNNAEYDRTGSGRTEGGRVMIARRPPAQSLIYVKMANNRRGEQYAVIIRAVISPVNATITTLRYQLYYISCIVLFFSVILAIIIAKRVSRPIEEISQSAMTLANGNYDTRFTGKGFYEIAALSDTLNTAAVELSRVENLRRELLANVSHDLRTPLALIYSYAEMMRDFPGEITPEQTQTIMDETQRLATLVNDILDISKLENEMEKLNTSRCNLTQSILETAKTTEKLLKKEGFEITFSHNGDVYVDADKAKIDRAFYNLLINAINYSGEKRNILVTQTVAGNRVRISVIDYGEGIAEADLPFIWDRYYKSGKAHKRAVTGSGLGLSIVKKIIDIHGAKYGVISETGKGSTFWFEIGLPESMI
ncbi:MAG: HAMP domain-containing histidine kinase [Spirochaetaceae bacterium]|jgi:signal transduction histidine kinase|nr:HAMP domain-containing histidine kinase [Spirochaetaceae bacterium]